MSKLLVKSNEEFSYGTSFQKLYDQISELNSSSVYLKVLPTLPITDQSIDIPSEETILSSLSSFINLKQEEEVWNFNSLYQASNIIENDDPLNQPLEEEKPNNKTEERHEKDEYKKRGRGGNNRWPRRGGRGRGTPIFHRV